MQESEEREPVGMKMSMRNRYLFVLAAIILVFGVLAYQIQAVFVALVFSLTLASAIAPIAEWMEEKVKCPRAITVALVYLLVIVLYSTLVYFLYPTLKFQAKELMAGFPDYAKGLSTHYQDLISIVHEKSGMEALSQDDVKSMVKGITSRAMTFTSDAITGIATAILVSFLTAYFVVEAPKIWPSLLKWVPHEHRDKLATTIRPLENRLGGYVRGQMLVSLAVGTFIGVGLKILGVPHALILAVLAGLLNLVPFVGSLTTAILAVIVAFNQSMTLAGLTVCLYLVEQWVESNFIVPQLLGTQVELHPLVVLFAILIGASLMGLAGALIAVPIATAAMYIAEEFYLKPLNEKHEVPPPDSKSVEDIEIAPAT